MEEEPKILQLESIPIDAPEGDFCLPEPEFPVKRVETVCGFQAGQKIVRTDTRDPITGQAIWQRVKLV